MIRLTTCLFLASLSLVFAQSLEEGERAGGGPPQIFEWELDLTPSGEAVFGGDIEGAGGNFDTWETGIDLNVSGPITPVTRLSLGVDYRYRHYDFKEPTALFPGTTDPWENVHSLGLSAGILQPFTKEWALFAMGGIEMAAADGAALSDGTSGNLIAGVGYRADENLTIGGGVMIAFRLEDDPLIIPAIQVDWKIDDFWRVRTTGPGAEVEYSFSEDLRLVGGAKWESDDFRLDDDLPTGGAVVSDSKMPLYLRGEWDPMENLTVTGHLGVHLFRELELLDVDVPGLPDELDFDVDPGVFLGFSGELSW